MLIHGRNYPAIIQHLCDMTSPHTSGKYTTKIICSSKNILKDLLSYDNVYMLYAFADFSSIVDTPSLSLETENVTIVEATNIVKNLKFELTDFGDLKGCKKKYLHSFLTSIDDENLEKIKYKNVELNTKPKARRDNVKDQAIDKVFAHLCKSTVGIINERFFSEGPCSFISVQLSCILNTAYFPSDLTDMELNRYGESEIGTSCDTFKISKERVITEWKEFRCIMFQHFQTSITLKELLQKIHSDTFKNMKCLTNVIKILLTVAPRNANVKSVELGEKHIKRLEFIDAEGDTRKQNFY